MRIKFFRYLKTHGAVNAVMPKSVQMEYNQQEAMRMMKQNGYSLSARHWWFMVNYKAIKEQFKSD